MNVDVLKECLFLEQDLKTNTRSKYPEGAYFDKVFQSSIQVAKGSMFGEFNLGSTIVLIFEAPKGFQFKVHDGQKIRFGQALGTLSWFVGSADVDLWRGFCGMIFILFSFIEISYKT